MLISSLLFVLLFWIARIIAKTKEWKCIVTSDKNPWKIGHAFWANSTQYITENQVIFCGFFLFFSWKETCNGDCVSIDGTCKEKENITKGTCCRWLSILLRMSTFFICHTLIKMEFSPFLIRILHGEDCSNKLGDLH